MSHANKTTGTFTLAAFAVLALVPLPGQTQTVEADDRAAVVRQFLEAFNAQDAAAMAALVTDDVQWLSVSDGATAVEVEGRSALTAAMTDYFSACPSCRSEIASLMSSRERVSVVEVASWDGADGPRSQRSMAVYEFSGALIRRVYYFPEEP